MERSKRHMLFAMFLLICHCVLLGACASSEAQPEKIKDLEYTIVGEDKQPDALKEIIEEKKSSEFQMSYSLGEDMYIVVGYGEQSSGGYSITVNEFYESESELYLDTTLLGPDSAENVTDVITTPYIVIKIENIEGKEISFN